MADSQFRERRSAFKDETDEAPDTTVADAEPAAAEAEIAKADTTADATAEPAEAEPADDFMEGVELPPASFLEIVQYLAIQAIQFLGDMPLNEAGERRVMPREAKHFIDLLGILEESTRGNLSAEESRVLEQILADLRVRWLAVGK